MEIEIESEPTLFVQHDRGAGVRRTRAELVEVQRLEHIPDLIKAFVVKQEPHRRELQAHRVEVWRNLAHLHPATAGRGSASRSAPPDDAPAANKRKIEAMVTLCSIGGS